MIQKGNKNKGVDHRCYGYINYVYFHRNKNSGDIFYVGIGSKNRATNLSNRSKYWVNYTKKYGKPTIEIYKTCLSWPEACNLEINLISLFGRKGIDKNGVLINRTLGGEGTLGRIVLPYTDETKAKIGAGNKGKVVSEESRKRMSESKKRLQFFAKEVINNITGEKYKSVSDAALKNGLTVRKVSVILRRSIKDSNQIFGYVNEVDKKGKKFYGRIKMTDETKRKISKSHSEKPYQAKIVINNITKEEYPTIKKAAKANGVAYSTMWAYINGVILNNKFSYKVCP